MCQNVVAFLLVIVEEEPKGPVGVVGSGDVAWVSMHFGIGHHAIGFFYRFLVCVGVNNVFDVVALDEVTLYDGFVIASATVLT